MPYQVPSRSLDPDPCWSLPDSAGLFAPLHMRFSFVLVSTIVLFLFSHGVFMVS